MVEIFKTNVEDKREAHWLVSVLNAYFPAYKINFDLSDCDKILRVEGENILQGRIMEILRSHEYHCILLD